MSEQKSDKWELPEPVFQSSTGELVSPSEHMAIDPEPDTLEPGFEPPPEIDLEAETLAPGFVGDNDPAEKEGEPENPLANLYAPPGTPTAEEVSTKSTAEAPEVEPQPLISEQFTSEQIPIGSTEPKKEGGGALRTALLTIVFLVILGIVGVLVALAYFYFAGRSSSSGF